MLNLSGVVWITDFGLAKSTEDALTHTGDVVGTLRYTVTLNNAPLSFSGVANFTYNGGNCDTIGVTPFATTLLPWDLAVAVHGGSSTSPASLTYYSVDSLADAVSSAALALRYLLTDSASWTWNRPATSPMWRTLTSITLEATQTMWLPQT